MIIFLEYNGGVDRQISIHSIFGLVGCVLLLVTQSDGIFNIGILYTIIYNGSLQSS
jgi:hypothetical protein